MNVPRKSNPKIPGTKTSLQNSQLLVSSGIPSLDHVIGGGISVGSVFLIEEDDFAKYSNVMFKYYLSEGIVCNHKLLLATLDNDPEKLLCELPSPTNMETETTSKPDNEMEHDMKIAWRYNDLTPVQSTLSSGLQFGHYFDISKPLDKDVLKSIDKSLWKYKSLDSNCPGNSAYKNLINYIKNQIEDGFKKTDKGENKNILRIGIQSLGSPAWQSHENHNFNDNKEDEGKHLIQFLYCLRSLLRSTYCVVFLTIPTLIFQNSDVMARIRHLVDGSVRLDAFAGTDRESNAVLRDYHGLFYMPKLLSMNTLAPYIPPTLDLAFKLRRRKFLIEKLHLPPELQESSEREQDDGSLLSCGSSKRRNLEF
ncbi:elongator complex protein 4 [Arctopsyche grandis]|uniref:elongator complex protein 4 n=1 Tax=Arctopsyche grandis TaxID=121162 RepID=UPI00406DA2F7